MTWMMILIAVHITDPTDQPGRIELEFNDRLQCERVLKTMRYDFKFKSFRVEGSCQQKQS